MIRREWIFWIVVIAVQLALVVGTIISIVWGL